MSKLTKFARKRPIARQRPFDVTFLTQDEFSAGDPVFMNEVTNFKFTGAGAFSVVQSANHVRYFKSIAANVINSSEIIPLAEDAGLFTPIFVGLCVTEGTRLQPSTAPGKLDGYRSIPTTIAGNQTMSMDAFMYLLGVRFGLEQKGGAMHVRDDLCDDSRAKRKLSGDKMIHAGTRIVIGSKVLRVIETVIMDGHSKSTSVSVILSSLSD